MTFTKKWLAFILLGFFTIALLGYLFSPKKDLQSAAPRVPIVRVTKAEPIQYQNSVSAYAQVHPIQHLDLVAGNSGIVEAIHVASGSFVEKGQKLISFEDSAARAQVEAARSEVIRKSQAVERARVLSAQGVHAQETLEQQKAELKRAQAALTMYEKELALLSLHAPFHGQIGYWNVQVHAHVNKGALLNHLFDQSAFEMHYVLPAHEHSKMQAGQHVYVETSLGTVQGHISYWDPMIDAKRNVFQVVALFPAHESLVGGQTMLLHHLYGDHLEAYRVPEICLRTEQQEAYLYVVENDSVSVRPVDVHAREHGYAIVTGIDESSQIIMDGFHRLRAKMPVHIDSGA